MNQKQKEYLQQWLKENSFTGEKEPEWTPPTVVHAADIEPLFEELIKVT